MHVSARTDYAVRATLVLATCPSGQRVKGEALATEQDIPLNFLENILIDLRRAGLVNSRRGANGGYWLARPAEYVTLADVIRAVDGPLARVQGLRPEVSSYTGPAAHLSQIWVAVRASLRAVLETVTLADVASGQLPESVRRLAEDPDAWKAR
ncbi:MAG: RrF2 family transcriptional regulator [Acidimicrobiales bacterium]